MVMQYALPWAYWRKYPVAANTVKTPFTSQSWCYQCVVRVSKSRLPMAALLCGAALVKVIYSAKTKQLGRLGRKRVHDLEST